MNMTKSIYKPRKYCGKKMYKLPFKNHMLQLPTMMTEVLFFTFAE